jgi:hypothetical protein
MTEAEWLTCADPESMLSQLGERASDRKLRLYAIACWRKPWPAAYAARCAALLELADRLADGRRPPGRRELIAALRIAYPEGMIGTLHPQAVAAVNVLNFVTGKDRREKARQADCVREVFRNPSHVEAADPEWLTWNRGTVRQLAQAAYDERAFERLPVLADALEEAGCADAAILAHCRGPGPHVRGCWVLDLLLGKE